MALVNTTTAVEWPPSQINPSGGAPAFSSILLDAANEKYACIIDVPKSGTIDKIGVRFGAITTGATLDVRIETVSTTTGDPTGTLWAANTNGALVVVGGDALTWKQVNLTAGAAVSAGVPDTIAIVIANPAAAFGNLNVSVWGAAMNFPYNDHFTAAWAKTANMPNIGIGYNDGSWGENFPCLAMETLTSRTFHLNTAGADEYALRFSLPFRATVIGFWAMVDLDGDAEFRLYDGTTVIATFVADANMRGQAGFSMYRAKFPVLSTLLINTEYRLAIRPTTATAVGLAYGVVDTAAIMQAMPGGTALHGSQRLDSGAWANTTTERPWLGLILSQLDDGESAALGGPGPTIWGPCGVSSIRY